MKTYPSHFKFWQNLRRRRGVWQRFRQQGCCRKVSMDGLTASFDGYPGAEFRTVLGIKSILPAVFLSVLLCPFTASTAPSPVQPFVPGSYQQLLDTHANQPFMLIVWSTSCSSCLKEMELLSNLHHSHPDLRIVMLATDDVSATAEIQNILEQHQLGDIESWVFAFENAQKLRFEIDPRWYGELPRTYFFDAHHHREGVSGVLTKKDYETRFAKMGIRPPESEQD